MVPKSRRAPCDYAPFLSQFDIARGADISRHMEIVRSHACNLVSQTPVSVLGGEKEVPYR
jgi:hypothetical protein